MTHASTFDTVHPVRPVWPSLLAGECSDVRKHLIAPLAYSLIRVSIICTCQFARSLVIIMMISSVPIGDWLARGAALGRAAKRSCCCSCPHLVDSCILDCLAWIRCSAFCSFLRLCCCRQGGHKAGPAGISLCRCSKKSSYRNFAEGGRHLYGYCDCCYLRNSSTSNQWLWIIYSHPATIMTSSHFLAMKISDLNWSHRCRRGAR